MNFFQNIRNHISISGNSGCSDALSVSDDAKINTAPYIRRAHHAGSWYSSDPIVLDSLLTKFLTDARDDKDGDDSAPASALGIGRGIPNACISPHAGFQYSGATAAYSYLALAEAIRNNPLLGTVLVIHPSHHLYMDGCAVSGASKIETPLGNLTVDVNLRAQLLLTKKFGIMEQSVDEEEHSGEMQYPYIRKIINDAKEINGKQYDIKVLPIMVGSIGMSKEESIGKLLSPFLSDRSVFTVISSDFCHWGRRFRYTPQPTEANETINEIYEFIEYLDRKGMYLIEMQRPGAFSDYLREYSNTICGRHPISVWLHSIRESVWVHDVRFVKYAQSKKARSTRDHSAKMGIELDNLGQENGYLYKDGEGGLFPVFYSAKDL